jgi:tetratricopeptide (TPR) repeat protein
MARDAFISAIRLDQADPLPRLGLGLAKIREGELEEGRRDIEVAASLTANNSLVRSYLGKAYFEEKRSDLDGREYAIAKELDPNDPTPWFYDAIRKQTINQPVEALQDLQKAIELNDNRAVYRSKLLLDSDLAARSASLARIYSDLGFQQRALVEGYNSVNTDPSNHSAHRFLADSYSVLPRHEIARVSELLQSQLLQPTNITPIQPRLAESNLLLISSSGAGNASFSEFNPLFNRNQVTLLASGLIGENSTGGGEAVVSGIYNKASFSVGYSKFQTDGFRENNDQEDDIANVFAQMELTHKTSIQAEYRYRKTERGDTALAFFADDFLPNIRQEDETDVIRVGFRHIFSPSSGLIGNFAYQNKDANLVDIKNSPPPPFPSQNILSLKNDETGYNGELQYLFRSDRFNITSGIGYFDIDRERTSIVEVYDQSVSPPQLVFSTPNVADADVEHLNIYLYSNIYLVENFVVTIGASGDDYEDNNFDKDQLNPKFGFIWNPVARTTLRGAIFSTVKRTLITNQTLEPTQVAGFNQFYDDANGSDTWRYGLGVDQKFRNDLYGGIELSKRDLNVPYLVVPSAPPPPTDGPPTNGPPTGPPTDGPPTGPPPSPQTSEVDWEESVARAYLYWTPNKWLGLRAEYIYEEFDRDKEFVAGTKNVKTHRIPLGISFFHSSGLTVNLQGTYFDQEGDFLRQDEENPLNFVSGEDQFWLVDLSLSYRFPKRYGFISIGVKNLFDEDFNYQDTNPENSIIQPDRMIYGQITMAF